MPYIESMTGRPMKKRTKYEPRLYRIDYRYMPVKVAGSIPSLGVAFEPDPSRPDIKGETEAMLMPSRQWDGVNQALPAKRGYHLTVTELRCLECNDVAWSWDPSRGLSLIGHERIAHPGQMTLPKDAI